MKKLLLAFLLGAFPTFAWAVTPAPYSLPVSFSFQLSTPAGVGGSGDMTVIDEIGAPAVFLSVPTGSTTTESSRMRAWLRPNKEYNISLTGGGTYDLWQSFICPQGYQLWVDGAQMDLIYHHLPGGGSYTGYTDTHTIILRPVGGSQLGAGVFSGIHVGKSVSWDVGLGTLRSGHTVGVVSFSEVDLSISPSSRAHLVYTPPTGTSQITVVRDVTTQVLKQIGVPQTVADFVDDGSGGYNIKFYDPTQATWGGSSYTFSGSPWRTIHVQSSGANQLTITETEGSVSRVSQLSATGSYSAVATGGTVTTSGSDTIHTFTSSGTFAVSGALPPVRALVVAGGGGGGSADGSMNGGGGGAGGLLYDPAFTVPGGSYSVTVGGGGTAGTNGSNSVFSSMTATGGGHGGGSASSGYGASGGSGGGAGTSAGVGSGTTGQGHNGGSGSSYPYNEGGGGGGAGASAGSITGGTYGIYDISGTSTGYAPGGGGGTDDITGGAGGGGGGGQGGGSTSLNGGAGTANRGSGGGGGGRDASVIPITSFGNGGAGGSGVVIIRYPTPGIMGSGNYGWLLQEGDGSTWLRTTTHASTLYSSYREDIVTVRTGGTGGTVVSQASYQYRNQGSGADYWGEELTQIAQDPATSNLITTFDYYTSSSLPGNYQKLKSMTDPTGNWTAYTYYDDWNRRGQVKDEFHPYCDSPSTVTFTTSSGRVVEYDYVADSSGRYNRKSDRKEWVNNVQTAHATWSYTNTPDWSRDRADMNSYRDSSNYHSDHVESVQTGDTEQGGEPALAKNADLSQTSWSRSAGTYSSGTFTVGSGNNWRELVAHGSTSSTGGTSESSFNSQSFDAIYAFANQSTMEVSIRDSAGNVIRTENRVYVGSSTWSLVNYTDFTYDSAGRLTQSVGSNGATTSYTITNGLLMSTKDPAGTETGFTYDLLWRMATGVKVCPSGSGYTVPGANITTTYTYDGANNVTQTEVTASGASNQTTTATYDLAGRQTQQIANSSASDSTKHFTTGIAYTSGGKIVTSTLPGGATKITEVYLDGQLKSVSGTGVVAENYSPFIDTGTGKKAVQSYLGGNTSAVTNTYFDWLARKTDEWKLEWDGNYHGKLWYYSANNHLYKFSQPGMADTLYVYDSLGALIQQGLDIDGNGSLDAASADRFSGHTYGSYTWDGGASWWTQIWNYTYATSGSGAYTFAGSTDVRLNLATDYLDQRYTYDLHGNYVYQSTTVDRTNKLLYHAAYRSDSTVWDSQVTYNGMLVSSTDTTNITTTFGYDALGRQTTSVDPRKGTTTTGYVSGTSLVSTITDPAGVTQATYTYDSAGRVATVQNGLSGTAKLCRYEYTARGEKYHTWGDTDYPVEYAYNGSGQMTSMSTYRGGSSWNATTWAGITTGSADTTTWSFDAATNLLASKTDAASKTVSYTYTVPRQLATRAWARVVSGTTHVTTSYSYSSTTGELTGVSYNDSITPSVTYTYNRLGQISTVAESVTGTRTFTYDLGGTLELQNEIVGTSSGDFYGDHRITRGYDTTTGAVGRYKRFSVGNSSNAYALTDFTYGYDTAGRLNSAYLFNYTYVSNSNLIQSTANSSWNYTDTRTYDSYHDWTASRTTTISSTTKAAFVYTPDNLGRTTQVAKTGEIYNGYGTAPNGLTTYYGYDDRSQLTSEVTKVGTTSTVLTGRNDSAYSYDPIGNRSSVTHNSNSATYTTNSVNQYSQRTVPSVFDVGGIAGSGTTVTVNGSSSGVTRHGGYFFDGYSVTNSSSPFYSVLAVSDGTTTTNVPAFVAQTAEAFTYDYDGNLLTDGRWTYTYDAENRLLTMETTNSIATASLPTALPKQKLTFAYDYLGRRVRKLVQPWTGSSYGSGVAECFLYDGWNLVYEFDTTSSHNAIRAYIWGLDLSGTLQGAGGVGGLLYVYDFANGFAATPAYDANGNIHALMTASSVTLGGHAYAAGDTVAAYEYDAFGNTLRESGDYADSNPLRYSTKFTDVETSLLYYGTRYYSPSMGRFINRDSIEEQGGLNLYAFVRNNGVNRFDVLGQDAFVTTTFDANGNPYTEETDLPNSIDRENAAVAKMQPGWDMMAQQSAAAAEVDAGAMAAYNLFSGNADADKQSGANWFGVSLGDVFGSSGTSSGSNGATRGASGSPPLAGTQTGAPRQVRPDNSGVTITNIAGPKVVDSSTGAFVMGIGYSVPSGANGVLLHEVDVTGNMVDSSGNPARPSPGGLGNGPTTFWEAWTATDGRVSPGDLNGINDIWSDSGYQSGSSGNQVTHGSVQFYPNATLADFPELHQVNGPSVSLPSSTVRPANWTDTGSLNHYLTLSLGPTGANVSTAPPPPPPPGPMPRTK